MRERLNHDKLLKRYMMKEGCLPQQDKKKDKISSFQPKLDDRMPIWDTIFFTFHL